MKISILIALAIGLPTEFTAGPKPAAKVTIPKDSGEPMATKMDPKTLSSKSSEIVNSHPTDLLTDKPQLQHTTKQVTMTYKRQSPTGYPQHKPEGKSADIKEPLHETLESKQSFKKMGSTTRAAKAQDENDVQTSNAKGGGGIFGFGLKDIILYGGGGYFIYKFVLNK
jgi:hypothetical protein